MYIVLSATGHGPSAGSEAAGERLVEGLEILCDILEEMGDAEMVEIKVRFIEVLEIDELLKFTEGGSVGTET